MRNAAFDRNLRRASWRYNARTIVLPVLLVTFGLVTFLLLAVNWRRADRERDVGAAPLRQSVARVTNVALQPVTRRMPVPRSLLTLRLPRR